MTVTRKVGTAVRRNRIKRLVREVFRRWPELVPHGTDLLVIAKDGAHELNYARVHAELTAIHGLLLKRVRDLDRPREPNRQAGPPRGQTPSKPQGRPERGPR